MDFLIPTYYYNKKYIFEPGIVGIEQPSCVAVRSSVSGNGIQALLTAPSFFVPGYIIKRWFYVPEEHLVGSI